MIQIKDIPDYSIILADSYLHHEIRKELCKDKKGRIISVLSFSNYIKTTQNIEQDQVLFSYYKILKPIENSFPVLKSILSTKQFLNEIFSFHTKRVKYKIDLNSLPVNSLAEKELAHIINITKDIQLPIDEEQESFSHILQKDLSNIYILESFMDKYEENCIQQLYKKGAHKINFKEVSPVTSFYYAKNIRQEVESVAQYIIEKDLDVNDIKISISQDSYQPFIKQIFERYQIPYRFIRQTKTSNTVNRFLSVLNYAEKRFNFFFRNAGL